ncbi:MAG: 4-hydroxy-tetrahydrodipicolinate reductase [Candidatus Omnitrophica bacterium]|nr:4-hydroxy-tetrahydrodipicolinate reductase [Candidatus Omnitrophota bacterium]
MIKIGITGFCGKMSQRIFMLAKNDENLQITVALEKNGHPDIGKAFGNITISDSREEIENCDCLIDFTEANATLLNLPYLIKYKKSAVIGTTGFSDSGYAKIKEAAGKIPIVFSPNMSTGVNIFFTLIRAAAKKLSSYVPSIEEAHHIHKKDAPSGTAKKIAQIIREEGFRIEDTSIRSIREDEIIGDHKIIFESDGDIIELSHKAKTRDILAKGAIVAAKWVTGRKKGLYSMNDVLAL